MSLVSWTVRRLHRTPREIGVAALVAWVAILWYLSSQSPPDPAGRSSVLRSWFMNLRHAPAFGLLGVLFLRAMSRTGERLAADGRRVAWALVAVVAYGCIDEWHQYFVAGRDASAFDVLTDLAGGWVLVSLLRAIEEGADRERCVRLLAIGVPACALAALVATLVPRHWPDLTWL